MDKAKISICITSYNRSESTINAFKRVLMDERVGEIVIVDDCSDIGYYKTLQFMVDRINSGLSVTKVFLYRNEKNLDCYLNKREAISKAKYKWVAIWDSDNQFDPNYLDALGPIENLIPWVVYCPSFAIPHFDFRTGPSSIDKTNVAEWLEKFPKLEVMFNAMNYVVHRDMYLSVFDDTVNPVTSDSIYQNYRLLSVGACLFSIVPDMEYLHPISSDSHYKLNNKRTPAGFHESIIQKIKELK